MSPDKMSPADLVDTMETHANNISKMHGIDPRHILLIQSVRELARLYREQSKRFKTLEDINARRSQS